MGRRYHPGHAGQTGRRPGGPEAVLLRHMAAGVLIDSRDIYIDETVQIAPGARILPGTILRGNTVIGAGCVIGPNTLIEDSVIGAGTTVNASQIYASQIGPHNAIGPSPMCGWAPSPTTASHLGAYVGDQELQLCPGQHRQPPDLHRDSDVGKYCNFGCGTVTCNYDGQNKFRTTIGDYCFIGCNTNLVAPVKVGNGAYTAAGSTITNDVPTGPWPSPGPPDQPGRLGCAQDGAYIEKKKALEETQRAEEANRQN